MKWKFCSEGDCPAWALASLHDVSALPAETLHQIVRHAMKDCGRCRDDDKVLEILKETPLNDRDSAARALAFIRWACLSALRANCPSKLFARELCSLGMPRVLANLLANSVETNAKIYLERVHENANLVTDILVSQAEHIEDSIKVQFLSKNPSESEKCFSFSISKTNAEKVIDKLNDARNVMERLNDVSSD